MKGIEPEVRYFIFFWWFPFTRLFQSMFKILKGNLASFLLLYGLIFLTNFSLHGASVLLSDHLFSQKERISSTDGALFTLIFDLSLFLWVLLNRAPTSTQLHPPPPSSLQHSQQYLNQNIARNWAISPN